MRHEWLGLRALVMVLVTLVPLAARAQDPGSAGDDAGAEVAAGSREPGTIRFSFKGATFEQVIDFFARTTGLPVVWETDPPEGTLDYLSPEEYALPEALRVLNIILQAKGVMLRQSDDMLYLQTLTEMQREDVPTYVGLVPADVTDDQIITVVAPLNIALATPLAEKLASMVASYGSVAAMEQQNALVITETAAQVRRILMIVDELDRADPEDAVAIIPLRHAKAADILESLKALLSKTVERLVMDQKNKPKKVQVQEMSGLSITADERTNSIIAKGVQARLDKLKEAIALLDVPTTGQTRSIRTFTTTRMAPGEAAAALVQLFAARPEDERPTVMPIEDVGAVTVIGPASSIVEAAAFLREVDGAPAADASPSRIDVVPLEHADPAAVVTALESLLTRRQRAVLRLLPGPDRRSLVLSGPASDVDAVLGIVPVLDVAQRVDRQVRVVRLTSADPAVTVARARRLYDREIEAGGRVDDPATQLVTELDPVSRTLTLIGSAEALARFATAMQTVESTTIVDRETRQLAVSHAEPSRLVTPLTALSRSLLEPRDGTALIEPVFEPVDPLDLLIVTALPTQFAVIETLVAQLDEPDPADAQFRVIALAGVSDVGTLLARAQTAYERLARGLDADEIGAPVVEHDTLSGNLIVSGHRRAVGLYEQALAETRRLVPPARSGRLLALRLAKAADVVEPLRALWGRTVTGGDGRPVRDPEIDVVERTNSLYVVAEDAQHAVVERFVRLLDVTEPSALPPLRLLQVRAADAAQLASMLRRRYDDRAAEQRREQPVTVDADAATNTLIVTAHEDVFAEIREFVDTVNRAETGEADRQTMIFPLKGARAADLAAALDKLYPEPPMPLDRRGRPMPHLREPREVYVSADAGTNTLIVEAPAERRASFEALVEQLDRVELPPTAELRTYHIERGDPTLIARTLTELARRGVMHELPADGSKPVEVLVQAEPVSRTLIVAGDAKTFEKTAEILRDLEVVPVQRTLRVFEVSGIDPQSLADRALRLYEEQTAEIPGAQPVSVEVDRDGGTLLAVAEDEAMFRFAGILTQLQDTIGPPPDVRLVALEHADANEVVVFLRDLADSHLAMVGTRAGPSPMFEAIERTNSVLVSARREQHDIIRALIGELDRLEPRDMPPLRILQLRTADAQNLAGALMRKYDQRPVDERNTTPVDISADPQTNALIVAAHPDLLPEIQGIVDELNKTRRAGVEGREIRIFPLKVARAPELAETLDEMFPEPPVPVDRRGRPLPNLREPREVVVRADAQTNSIIVDAPVQRMAGFEELVAQLDRAKIADETEIRTYPVVHARLETLAATLRELAQAGSLTPAGQDRRVPITVSAEPVSETLIVSGPVEIFPRVAAILEELDVKRAGPATALRFFRLEHARAETLAPMLREILLSRIDEDVPDAGADVQALLNVTADRKTNTLIISAPESILPVAEELVAQLDDGTARLGDPIVRVRPLAFADAGDVSNAITGAVRGLLSTVTGEPVDVRLIPAVTANAIILVGLDADVDAVEGLIAPLDERPALDAISARTFTLEYAEAGNIATIVQGLLADQLSTDPRIVMERIRRSRGRIDLTPTVRVEADERTNSLIVSAPARTLALAQTLIDELDRPDADGDRTFATFTPESADAAELATAVRRVLAATRPGGRRSTIELVAEPRTGAVLVIGTETEVAQAKTLLAERDAATVAAPPLELRLVTLEHSAAEGVARVLGPLLADRGRWPPGLQRAARAGATIGEPSVTAEAGTNRLLVSAPSALMPMATTLIDELDQPRAGGATLEVRVFGLEQAEAAGVARAVAAAMTARAARQPGLAPVTVTAEPSSGSVIVTAAADQMSEIEAIVTQLDERYAADQVQVRTVFLEHARAETVAPIVEQLLEGEEVPFWMRVDAARRGRPLPDAGPDVRVAADVRLNAVVISAPAPVLNIAEQMVVQLDVDPGAQAGRSRTVQVLAIENADAAELAANIEALFGAEDASELPPTVRVDRASNSLLVRATETQFASIEGLAARIDRATISTSRQMRLIPIDPTKASADEVARTLQRLLDRAGGGGVEVITLEELLERREPTDAPAPADTPAPPADASSRRGGGPFTNALVGGVLATPRPGLEAAARDFVAWLENGAPANEPSSPPSSTPAPAADPIPVAFGLLDDLDAARDLTIAVDPATNSLVVIGAPRALDRLAALATQVQMQLPGEPRRVRYVALPPETDAGALANLVDRTLRQLTPAGGRPGDVQRRATVLADRAGNALVITASDSDFETIGDLVAALARPPAPDPVIVKVYPLETISAERAAASVQQLVDPDAGRPRGRQAQRMRTLAIRLLADDESIDAVFEPGLIRIAADPQTNAIVVRGPEAAIPFIDRYVELIDQAPVNVQTTLKLYPLRQADATDLRETLRGIFQARFRSLQGPGGGRGGVTPIQPEFAADDRTNTLLVTASPEQLVEVDGLLEQLDVELGEDVHPLRSIEMASALPSRAAEILDEVVVGSDQRRRTATLIVPDDNSGVLLVRASAAVNAEIDRVLREVDRDAARAFEVRTITLERADANAVADALQRFFDDRARIASAGRGRREQTRRVSIIGDPASKTILVAASDADFAQIEELAAKFDSPQSSGVLAFRVFQLRHAKADEIADTVNNLIDDLMWNQGPWFWFRGSMQGQQQRSRGSLAVRADARLNALIATGEGDKFDMVEELIELLDAPPAEGDERIVRLYRLENARIEVVADIVRDLFTDPSRARRWWQPPKPNEVKIRVDEARNTLIVSGVRREHDEIAAIVAQLEAALQAGQPETTVVPVEYAQARDLERTLRRFLADRATATGQPRSAATVIASDSANALVVSATGEELATLRDLLGRLDQPDVSGDRTIEIIVLQDGDADEIARIVREQFGRRSGGRGGAGVVVTADIRTNSIIVNAPQRAFAQARALIEQLDTRGASDETIIRTYALAGAQARDVVRILTETLQLDDRGETSGITIKLDEATPAVEVKAKVVADGRSNSLVVTATAESFPVIESLVRQLDEVPAASPVEYRIIALEHALADEVVFTLERVARWRDDGQPAPSFDYNRLENQLVVAATTDQFEQITAIVAQIDQPSSRERITDFVPLEFAEAEKVQEALSVFYGWLAPEADTPGKATARIVADPATNSLVITADEAEWTGIRALLAQLDSAEYDSSLQLQVIPLVYADARSVASAINEAFQGRIERDRRAAGRDRERSRGGGSGGGDERREPDTPTVLVEAEEWVRAAAERQTNAVIVSASRQNLRKIEQIVEQLDVADYAKLPAPRLIPVVRGDAEQLAEALDRLYEPEDGERGRQGLRIVGDSASSTVIVRAEDEEFQQIAALATALQTQSEAGGLAVHLIPLHAAPARRVAAAISEAFAVKAERTNQPLTIEVDADGNNLVVASTAGLYEEIRKTVEQLDALAPAAGQGIFIIELENITPEEAKRVIESIGLHETPSDDTTRRLVTEPVRVAVLGGRRALIVIANPADRDTIVGLLKTVDAVPELAEAQMLVLRLRHAEAGALARLLGEVLTPGAQQAGTPLARAIQEQVRRLAVRRDGLDEGDLTLDLATPIRLIPDAGLNAILVSSTPENTRAVAALVAMLDELPITDAVTVQLFPLENIAASDFARIVRDLFTQGKQLGRVPGADLEGVPAGMVGRALVDEIAMTVDERTNTVVVAGKEEAVALVEVLTKRLDSDVAAGWVEPRVVSLKFADATDLAETIQAILVEGTRDLPQSTPLQRQVGRLRMARLDENGGKVLESDVFQPMTRLVVRPEPQLNALVLVGTPINLEVIGELVTMLDVAAASPDATVRIYPVEHASAARLQTIITRLFEQQVQSKAIRPEDRVIVQADDRTNAIIVTTSPRSFAVLESLLETLDAEVAPDLREIRRLKLEHASAARLSVLVQQLMDARLERLRRVQPETAELERATIVADPRTNSLVIAAGNESYEVIRRLSRELDRTEITEDSLVKVITLDKGNIDRIQQTIDAVMERRYADLPAELRASQKPLVMTDPRSNSLLVAANPEDLTAIENLVVQLEAAPSDPAVGLHVVTLPPSANAEAMAPRLQRLMRERQQSLGAARRPSDAVTIEPDAIGNSLIVAASEENVEIVRGLVDVLVDAGEDAFSGRGFEVIPLRASRAADIVDLVQDLYVEEANRSRGAGSVSVSGDDRTNAVLVRGHGADVEAVRALVERLDGAKPSSVVEIKYIALESANALETVGLIENVLSGRGIGARRTAEQATVLKYLRELADGVGVGDESKTEMEVSAAIRESIVLTPDLRTNTIIVTAPRQSMSMIERMIRDLDQSSTGAKSIRIFKLANADATAMQEILVDLFNLRQGSNLLVLKPREGALDAAGLPAPGEGGLGGTDLTAVPDERQQLSITVDSRTNSLLVSGTPTYLDLVSQVVEELDALEANERDVFVYQLRNAEALEVARVLGEFIRQEQEKLVGTLSPDQLGSAARLLEREITIQGDEKSNTVLVSASPRYMSRVEQMIKSLDVDPPQVLIQVLLAEVTLDSEDTWGVDLEAMFQIGGATIGAGYGLASTLLTSPGTPFVSIASSDFNMLIEALQEQGRVAVLSNPTIMAANNEDARIQVGEEIRVAEASALTEGGNLNTSTTARETGVILDVRPSINPDGFVRLQVTPEISRLSQETTQINESLETPIINVRTATTTVTVHDGQTIILGGLVSDRFERREQKVPLLGDIPLLGALFRNSKQDMVRTELLIVLTPHVVMSPAELERVDELTGSEIDRLTLPNSIKDAIRDGKFDLSGGLFDAEGNPIEVDFSTGDAEQDGE